MFWNLISSMDISHSGVTALAGNNFPDVMLTIVTLGHLTNVLQNHINNSLDAVSIRLYSEFLPKLKYSHDATYVFVKKIINCVNELCLELNLSDTLFNAFQQSS